MVGLVYFRAFVGKEINDLKFRNSWILYLLQSCFKVALDFVTPENVLECIRLTEEFRLLPKGHRARENMLEVLSLSAYFSICFVILILF